MVEPEGTKPNWIRIKRDAESEGEPGLALGGEQIRLKKLLRD